MSDSRRRRSIAVVAGGTAVFAALFVHHESGNPRDYQGVCADRATQTRVADDNCDGSHGGVYHHVFYPRGSVFPAVGGSLRGATPNLPAGHAARLTGASVSGGEVARGGFGSTSRGWHGWSVGG